MIISEGALLESEVKDLQNMRNTEFFRIMRKLCAHEYSKLAELLTGDLKQEDLQVARGMMRGIKMIYGLLLANAKISYVDGKLVGDSDEMGLPKGKRLRNLKVQED